MGGQNFTEEHFILHCVDVHAQGQGMTAITLSKCGVKRAQGSLTAASGAVLGKICFA